MGKADQAWLQLALFRASSFSKKEASVHTGHMELPAVHAKEPLLPSTNQGIFCIKLRLSSFNFLFFPVNSFVLNYSELCGTCF